MYPFENLQRDGGDVGGGNKFKYVSLVHRILEFVVAI